MSKVLTGSELTSEIVNLFEGVHLCKICGEHAVMNGGLCRECLREYEVEEGHDVVLEEEEEISPARRLMRWVGVQVFFHI